MSSARNHPMRVAASTVATPQIVAVQEGQFCAKQFMREDNSYQSGHYPGEMIYPGVFLIESVFNATRSYFATERSQSVELKGIDRARFIAPGRPGKEFRINASIQTWDDLGWRVEAVCLDGEEKLATAAIYVTEQDDG